MRVIQSDSTDSILLKNVSVDQIILAYHPIQEYWMILSTLNYCPSVQSSAPTWIFRPLDSSFTTCNYCATKSMLKKDLKPYEEFRNAVTQYEKVEVFNTMQEAIVFLAEEL